jgi:hypothetical protein
VLALIQAKEALELDAEFKENHVDILKRFYMLFESIWKYVTDYVRWLDDVDQGIYIQQSLEVRQTNYQLWFHFFYKNEFFWRRTWQISKLVPKFQSMNTHDAFEFKHVF